MDNRIGTGAPVYEAALMSNNYEFMIHNFTDVDPGSDNDTTPRYDVPAVELAWQRTIVFFLIKTCLGALAGLKRVNYPRKFCFV